MTAECGLKNLGDLNCNYPDKCPLFNACADVAETTDWLEREGLLPDDELDFPTPPDEPDIAFALPGVTPKCFGNAYSLNPELEKVLEGDLHPRCVSCALANPGLPEQCFNANAQRALDPDDRINIGTFVAAAAAERVHSDLLTRSEQKYFDDLELTDSESSIIADAPIDSEIYLYPGRANRAFGTESNNN